jgi:hypothetical protein
MLTPPDDMSHTDLMRVLGDGWGLAVASIDYRSVGFGSHHWDVVDTDGVRRFLTVDDLAAKGRPVGDPVAGAFGRLRAALTTATDLRHYGATFVIAPIPTLAGEPLVRTAGRFAVALYPYVDGQSFSSGHVRTLAQREGVLDLVVALHAVPTKSLRCPVADDFTIPHRDELELSFHDTDPLSESGPYARRASKLLIENETKIGRLLVRYDGLVKRHSRQSHRSVITHGEPHPGNTMLTSSGWVLIDWDTALVAPPERDLWMLDPGDGSIVRSYADDTGTIARPLTLELYRIRWDLADISAYVNYFRALHSGSLDDEESWDELCALIGRLPA